MPSELICCNPVEFHIGTKSNLVKIVRGTLLVLISPSIKHHIDNC